MTASPLDAILTTCRIDPVWFVWVELWEGYDDARVRNAVMDVVALDYGALYDRVCFESGTGTQFCRAKPGARPGQSPDIVALPVRTLTFSLPRDPVALASAIEAVRAVHSYEEPVIYVTEGFATRTDPKDDAKNPNRYFNRTQSCEHP